MEGEERKERGGGGDLCVPMTLRRAMSAITQVEKGEEWSPHKK